MRGLSASSSSMMVALLHAAIMWHHSAAHSISPARTAQKTLEPRLSQNEATPLQNVVPSESAIKLTASSSAGTARVKDALVLTQPATSRFGPESPTVLGAPGDWLFSVATTECDGSVAYDTSPNSAFSKAVLVVLFGLCVLAVSNSGTWVSNPDQGSEPMAAPQEATAKGERRYYLDFCRICAIGCVVFEHCGGTSYTYRNVGFGLWWALPYLYMTSGMLYTFSSSSLVGYVLRLFAILMIGVLANLVGDLVSGRDWRGDPANTVFQMWFVVMLMSMAVVMAPLRQALLWHVDYAGKKQTSLRLPTSFKLWLAACGLLAAGGAIIHVLGIEMVQFDASSSWAVYYSPLARSLPLMAVQIFGCAFVAALVTMHPNPQAVAHVGWVLLAFLYIPLILMPFDLDGFPHLIGLYIFSMVAAVKPLTGSDTIRKAAQAYWPFIFMFLCLLAMPDMYGRCDVHPAGLIWERLRFCMGEYIMVVLFATGAFECGDPFNVTGWMGWWSLYAYCFHVCWFRSLGTPVAAVVTFGSILPFYMMHHMGWLGKKPQEKSLEKRLTPPSDDVP